MKRIGVALVLCVVSFVVGFKLNHPKAVIIRPDSSQQAKPWEIYAAKNPEPLPAKTNPATNVLTLTESSIFTRNGKLYDNVEVLRIEPNAITFNYSNADSVGAARVSFTNLFPKAQSKYGYDPEKSAEYEAKVRELNRDLAIESAQDRLNQSEAKLKELDDERKEIDREQDLLTHQQQIDALDRAADAQERQADALEQQNQEIDDIDWDLRYKHY